MMMQKELEKMEETEIDLKDFMLRVCLQWRRFIVFMLLGAVLLGGFVAVRSHLQTILARKYAEMSVEEYEQLQKEQLQQANVKLEKQEIAEVRSAFQIYQDAFIAYDAAMEYSDESIKMHLNANSLPTLHVSYYIDNHYEATYPVIDKADNTNAICSALAEIVNGEDVCNAISENLNWNKDNRYISELITTEMRDGILYITILAPTEENCEKIWGIISNVMGQQSRNVEKKFGEFDMILLEEHFEIEVNVDLQNEQESQNTNIRNLKSTYENAGMSLDATQKKSFDALVEIYEIRLKYFKEHVDSADELIEMPEANYFQKKYILLGAIIGMVLYGIWLMVAYLLSPKLHVAEELEYRYGVVLLSTIDKKADVKKNEKHKWFYCIDKLIFRIFGCEKAVDEKKAGELAGTEIRIIAKKQEIEKIYLASTCGTKLCTTVQDSMCDMLKKELVIGKNVDDILANAKNLEQLAEYEGVVLIEECSTSLYKDIKQIVLLCKRSNIPVIGSVVIEK